jgi:hypothetical protein
MKRFYFGNDEGGDDDESEEFEPPLPTEFISMSQIESPWRHMLDSAIRICEKSLMWSFMSPASKMETVQKVFRGLSEIQQEYEQDADI